VLIYISCFSAEGFTSAVGSVKDNTENTKMKKVTKSIVSE